MCLRVELTAEIIRIQLLYLTARLGIRFKCTVTSKKVRLSTHTITSNENIYIDSVKENI